MSSKRAAHLMKGFLREASVFYGVKVLIKRYFFRVMSIQRKFKQYRSNIALRLDILLDGYRAVCQSTMFVKNPKKKEREFQEKLRNIDPAVRDWVFKRYISYCKDQHAFVFLAYRRKLHQLCFSPA